MSQGDLFLRLVGVSVKDLNASRETCVYILPDNETIEWLITVTLKTTEEIFATIIQELNILDNCKFSYDDINKED